MPKLKYSVGGEERTLEVASSCRIGRDEGNDVVLDASSGASRRHCQIIKLQDTFELADLGSTNGTFVNGEKVKRHKLKHGDKLRVGEANLAWSDPDSAGDDVDLEDEISLEDPGGGGGGRRGGAAGEKCYAVFAKGPKDGEKLPLDRDRVTFGRKASNTVVLDDTLVSGYHCEISREGGAYVLRDLGSTNGTLLDGEPITEIVLQHGGRIRVGGQLLIFVDPSVADFEKAMSAVDDLGSEWGLLRAEMDMDRVQRARRSQVVFIVGLLAVVGVGGWVVWTNKDMFRKEEARLDDVPGNLLADFSFEGGGEDWAPAPGSPAFGTYERGEAKQGQRSYSVRREGPTGRAAIVDNRSDATPLKVRPGAAYEFGAAIRAANGGQGALRITWIGQQERYAATPLVSSSGWTTESAVSVAPSDALKVRIEMLNAGTGSVAFDDIFFKVHTGSSGDVEVADGDLAVSATPLGALTVRRGNQILLEAAGVVGDVFPESGERTDRHGERSGSTTDVSVTQADSGIELSGKVYLPAKGELGDFSLLVRIEGSQVRITGDLPASAGLLAALPEQFVENGIGVFTSSGRSFRLSDTRIVPGAVAVKVGDDKRFQVTAADGKAAFALGLLAAGDNGYQFALGSSAGGVDLVLETDARKLIEAQKKHWDDGRDSETQKRYGAAIKSYRQFLGLVTEGDPEAVAATQAVQRLEALGAERLAALQTSVTDALAFQHEGDLRAATAVAGELETQYAGHPVANGAGEQRARVGEALDALSQARRELQAEPVLARAQDFIKYGQKELARAFLGDVTTRFEGTAAAKTAAELLNQLGER